MKEIKEDEIKPTAINPDGPIAQGLLRMLQHKQLREKFWFGEITFEELNKQLLEKGINKQYEHPAAVQLPNDVVFNALEMQILASLIVHSQNPDKDLLISLFLDLYK